MLAVLLWARVNQEEDCNSDRLYNMFYSQLTIPFSENKSNSDLFNVIASASKRSIRVSFAQELRKPQPRHAMF